MGGTAALSGNIPAPRLAKTTHTISHVSMVKAMYMLLASNGRQYDCRHINNRQYRYCSTTHIISTHTYILSWLQYGVIPLDIPQLQCKVGIS